MVVVGSLRVGTSFLTFLNPQVSFPRFSSGVLSTEGKIGSVFIESVRGVSDDRVGSSGGILYSVFRLRLFVGHSLVPVGDGVDRRRDNPTST